MKIRHRAKILLYLYENSLDLITKLGKINQIKLNQLMLNKFLSCYKMHKNTKVSIFSESARQANSKAC